MAFYKYVKEESRSLACKSDIEEYNGSARGFSSHLPDLCTLLVAPTIYVKFKC